MNKLYRVVAKRTSYEELYIEAGSESDAIALITMGDEEYDCDEYLDDGDNNCFDTYSDAMQLIDDAILTVLEHQGGLKP